MRNACLAAGLFVLTAGWGFAGEAPDVRSGWNVRDFGAVGDGVADDTRAIQRALNALHEVTVRHIETLARQPMLDGAPELGDLKLLGSTSEGMIVPELFFPAGTYRLTETIVARTYTYLRGEDGTVLRQENPEKDLLYFHPGFRMQLRNLAFEGGRRQALFFTRNEDTANVTVEDCRFSGASDMAVWSLNYRHPTINTYPHIAMGPYEVEWVDGVPHLTPNEDPGRTFNNSTNITFTRCVFENNRRVGQFGGDGAVMEDCVLRVPADAEGPALLLAGKVSLLNVVGVAEPSDASRYWIETSSYGLAVEGGSFTAGVGKGMPLVRVKRTRRGEAPDNLIVRNVDVACADAPENAVIYAANAEYEASTPMMLDLSGVREISGRSVRAVAWEVEPDAERMKASLFDISPAVNMTKGRLTLDMPFRYAFQDNTGLDETLPPAVAKFRSAPIPAKALAEATVPAVRIDAAVMARHFPRRLRAVDFGVDLDPATDDTAGMKRALAAATEGAPAIIEIPPVLVRVSEALQLPPEAAFEAPGLATLRQTNLKLPLFEGKGVRRLWMSNLRLVSGRRGVDLAPRADVEAEILVEKCYFYQQLDAAVACFAGDGKTGEPNQTRLLVRNCTFISPVKGVITNAAHSDVDNAWISTNGRQDREAFFDNRGGAMRAWNLLGVPMPMRDHIYNHLPFVPDWPYANDLRWFDNHGRLDIRHSRFGGEYHGIPVIFHFAKGGTVMLDGGMTCFLFHDSRQCIADFKEAPDLAVFRSSGWTYIRPASASFKGKLPPKNAFFVRNFLWENENPKK